MSKSNNLTIIATQGQAGGNTSCLEAMNTMPNVSTEIVANATQEGVEDEGTAAFVPWCMMVAAMLAMISNVWTYCHLNENFTATQIFFRVLKADAVSTLLFQTSYIGLSVGSMLDQPNHHLCTVATIPAVLDFMNLFIGRAFIHGARSGSTSAAGANQQRHYIYWCYIAVLLLISVIVTSFAAYSHVEELYMFPEFNYCVSYYSSLTIPKYSLTHLLKMASPSLPLLLTTLIMFGNDIKEFIIFSKPQTLIGGKTQRKVEPLLQRIPFRMVLISLFALTVLITSICLFLSTGPKIIVIVEALVIVVNIIKGPITIFWTIRPNPKNSREKTPAERQKEVIQLAQQERSAKNQEETAV